jgi:site-specific DNA-methyltransferase (cytosine-N4-specific)
METLLKNPDRFYTPKERPSGHDIAKGFGKRNAGAIPSNLLQIPNTDSNSHYLRTCKMLHRESHPARYPGDLPRFFINFLTDPDDLVMDIFSGSNTTGHIAEETRRQWISIESDRQFAVLSAVRFMTAWDDRSIEAAVTDLENGRVIDLEAGLSLGPTNEAPRLVGYLQNHLFE